jgi:hypothetical protein
LPHRRRDDLQQCCQAPSDQVTAMIDIDILKAARAAQSDDTAPDLLAKLDALTEEVRANSWLLERLIRRFDDRRFYP